MNHLRLRSCLCFVACLAGPLLLPHWNARAGTASAAELPGIHNFFRATTNVFSGSQPEGDAGFAALKALGVRTIISVDGAKPDVELAAKHGLRYVHLPFGYDGIPAQRVAELAKAATVLPGPIYVHCHHGKHRGPAAVSVICLADEGWTPGQAKAFMHLAGTGPEYTGLYRAAQDFKPLTARQLAMVATNFPSVAETPSLVDAMVALDARYANLQLARSAEWQTPAHHPDLSPKHEALMLQEQFVELERMPEVAGLSAGFRARLHAALSASTALRQELEAPGSPRPEAAFNGLSQACADCHRQYRNPEHSHAP